MSRPLDLPIDPFLPQVEAALRARKDVVLVAEPGAGKTTRVPPAIVGSGLLGDGKLVMLQPRRVAARAAASRIADEQGWRVGEEVGYQVRFEKVLTARTPLRIVTEGVLVRQLVSDPSLGEGGDGVGCVVVDEFHERSLDADLALAMLKEAKGLREDLRIVVMSATLDADAVASFLGDNVEVLHVPGRLFPVDIEYAGDDPRPVEERVARVLRGHFDDEAAASASGDVLVFLPGVREIENTMREIRRDAERAGYDVLPLHGQLEKEEQDEAVRFIEGGRPRVICATNVAETSLTLPGVRLVVDSGLVRQAGYDAKRGVSTLTTERISRASAEQRAGRAGRVAAGRCIRLWSRMTHNALPAYDVPEVRRTDLCDAALAVRAWGGDPATFDWFERPDAHLLAAADKLLSLLGAVEDNRITPTGRALQAMPLHPRPARLMTAAPASLQREAATLAAAIGEGVDVPGRRTASVGELLVAVEARKIDTTRIRRARDALLRMSDPSPKHSLRHEGQIDSIAKLLLIAYPDRVCRRRSTDVATLATGGGVRLPEPSAVRGDWFLALDLRRGNFAKAQQADVSLVAEIEVEWLGELLPQHVTREQAAEWDEAKQAVVAVRRTRYLDLVLDEQRGGKVDPDAAREVLATHFELWPALERSRDHRSLIARIDLLRQRLPKHLRPDTPLRDFWNDVYDAAMTAALSEGNPSAACLVKRAGEAVIAATYTTGWDRALSQYAPETIQVPSGSNIRLDYNADGRDLARLFSEYEDPDEPAEELDGERPVLAVRLQELFGLAQTPRVCGGAVPVMLHLLGPNMRPVQVTDDLASFWKNTYPQVRKDLRARYAKHSWPENPLEAPPMRGAKRRRPDG